MRAASRKRARGIVEEVQDLMHDDEVVGVALHRRRVDVALAQQHVAKSALRDARAGEAEHRRALIDAHGAHGERRDQFEHSARAGSQIQHRLNRRVSDHREDRRLDALLGRVQRADAVPIGGAFGEIGGRLLAPGLARDFQPGPIGSQSGIVGRDAGDQIARERPALVGQTKERPGALALALREAGVDQQLEMARDAWLRLPENRDQFAHRQFGLAKQAQQPQPRDLARGFERVEQGVETQAGRGRRRNCIVRHKDMFMSIFCWTQAPLRARPGAILATAPALAAGIRSCHGSRGSSQYLMGAH